MGLSRPGLPPVPYAPFLDWHSIGGMTGNYTVAPSVSSVTVLSPSGAAPTEAALGSHRYHHHVRVGYFGGTTWIAFSSSGTNEDAGGQMVVGCSSLDGGATWSAPVQILAPQSPWTGTGATGEAGSYIGRPRWMMVSSGQLYLISSLDHASTYGLALFATPLNTDGSVGTTVCIAQSERYAQYNGSFPVIAYDGTAAAALFPNGNLYGSWGGSYPNAVAVSSWTGWVAQDGCQFTEPAVFNKDSGTQNLGRLWRQTSGNDQNWFFEDESTNGGTSWSVLSRTNIPNSPSAPAALRLTDGRIAVCFNPRNNGSVARDPLALALFNGTTGRCSALYAIRQGLTDQPTYPGTAKQGGAAYSGLWQNGNTLMIGYSMQKESIGFSTVDVTQL